MDMDMNGILNIHRKPVKKACAQGHQ